MQIVSKGDNLHETSKPILLGKKKKKEKLPAEILSSMLSVKIVEDVRYFVTWPSQLFIRNCQ